MVWIILAVVAIIVIIGYSSIQWISASKNKS